MTDALVDVRHDDGIRTLTLDSPANRNALSSRLLDQLAQALRDATADAAVRAVVLTGAGTVFCSGADLSERGSAAPNRMPEILTTMEESPVPVLARVNGHARAGGLGLIAAADMAVAASAASFAFTEVRVGVAPAMILVPALRVMEHRFLARMVLTGERFDAHQAAAAGLLSAVVETEDDLDAWVSEQTTAPPQGGARCGPRHEGTPARVCRHRAGRTGWRPPPRRRPNCSPARRRRKAWPPSWRSASPSGTPPRERADPDASLDRQRGVRGQRAAPWPCWSTRCAACTTTCWPVAVPQYVERHRARGKLMVRERVDGLVDPGTPVLELSPAGRAAHR